MTELLTAEQAAARLSMSERTLRKLRQSGAIAYIALTDRMFRYTPEDCDEYLAACHRRDGPPPTAKIRARHTSSMTSRRQRGFMDRLAAEKRDRGDVRKNGI